MRALLILLTMVVGVSAVVTVEAKSPWDPERTALVRATYVNVPPDILGIVEPIVVLHADIYEDGGTGFVRLKDARGTELVACLDGRIVIEDELDEDFWASQMKYVEHRHLYLHADYPTDAGALEVLVRGPEETALYGLLLRWARNQPRTEEIAAMETVVSCPDGDMVLYRVHHDLLERFDWRFGIKRPE